MKNIINILFYIILIISFLACNKNEYIENSFSQKDYIHHIVEAPFEMPDIREFIFPKKDFDIRDYGADEQKNDIDINTDAIRKAIDACNKGGGGRVVVPHGVWKIGPIHLLSNVNLYISDGAVLRFSDDPINYLPGVFTSWEGMECYNYSPLIYAYNCENIAITGGGTLNPNMDTWKEWFKQTNEHMNAVRDLYMMVSTNTDVSQRQMASGDNNLRPHLIQFNRCSNILLDGFKIRESPFWTIHLYHCDNGIVRNLDVKAHGNNNDGIDIEMSKNFLVENCQFDQGDDAIVIKSGRNQDGWRLNTPSENIVIRNCNIFSGHGLLSIGSELSGGVKNIYMSECSAFGQVYRILFIKTNHQRGGFVNNIIMNHIKADDVRFSVFEIDTNVLYQYKDFPTYETKLTSIRNIHLKNIECGTTDIIYDLKGDPGNPVGNIFMENIKVGNLRNKVGNVVATSDLSASGIVWNQNDTSVINTQK